MQPESLRSALKGTNVVYFTASGSSNSNLEVDEIGVKNTVEIAKEEGTDRTVLVFISFGPP